MLTWIKGKPNFFAAFASLLALPKMNLAKRLPRYHRYESVLEVL